MTDWGHLLWAGLVINTAQGVCPHIRAGEGEGPVNQPREVF